MLVVDLNVDVKLTNGARTQGQNSSRSFSADPAGLSSWAVDNRTPIKAFWSSCCGV